MLLAQAPNSGAEAPAEKPKIIVLELTPAGGVDAEVGGALSEAIANHIAQRGMFTVMSQREMQTLVSMERQRQLLGCGSEGSSCMAELAGALGARFVLSGTIARLGNSYQLTLQTLDSEKAQTVGRATRIAPTLEDLRALLPWAIADATGAPPPPRPSNVLSYSLVLAGGLAAAGGAVVGVNALSREAALQSELDVGQTQSGVLKSADYYREEAKQLYWQKRGAIVAGGVGVALIGLGALLYEKDPTASSGVALVPSANGFALVGVFQ